MIIKNISARIIRNSKDLPVIEACINNSCASAPSGTSIGKYEAKELPAKLAIKKFNAIKKVFIGKNANSIDNILIKMAGNQKKNLGTNMTTAISMAAWKHKMRKKRLPKPMFNMIEGGLHAKNKLSIQEFLVIPKEKNFKQNLAAGKEIYNELKSIIEKRYGKAVLGMEAGYQPPVKITHEALELILTASEKSGYGVDLGLDAAANSFYRNGRYLMDGIWLDEAKLLKYYTEIASEYSLFSIEDPFNENDISSFSKLKNVLGKKTMIVGDDITVTNKERIKKYRGACNAVIIKINQVGTVSEALEAIKAARRLKMKVIVSHRSGETKDDFIADFSAFVSADFIKSGAPATPWRMNKYNRLLKL